MIPWLSVWASSGATGSSFWPETFWSVSAAPTFIPAPTWGIGKDDTLFALKDGRVKFERLGKDRKQVSIVEAVAE